MFANVGREMLCWREEKVELKEIWKLKEFFDKVMGFLALINPTKNHDVLFSR